MKKTTNELMLKTWRVKRVHEATEIASLSDCLSGDVAYWITRLADWSHSIVRSYERTIQTHLHANKLPSDEWAKLSSKEQNERNKQHDDFMFDLEEGDNKIPFTPFEFNDFVAKEDRISYLRDAQGNIVQRQIKAGETLLPQRFFNLMGELIITADKKN